jgi:hypothetical protein
MELVFRVYRVNPADTPNMTTKIPICVPVLKLGGFMDVVDLDVPSLPTTTRLEEGERASLFMIKIKVEFVLFYRVYRFVYC